VTARKDGGFSATLWRIPRHADHGNKAFKSGNKVSNRAGVAPQLSTASLESWRWRAHVLPQTSLSIKAGVVKLKATETVGFSRRAEKAVDSLPGAIG
jgi:hypothetical protein